MKQYFYFFLITTSLNFIRGLIVGSKYSSLIMNMKNNMFWAMVTTSILYYLIIFGLMFTFHFLLKYLFNISNFRCYLLIAVLGFLVSLLFFVVYLGHGLLETLFKNHIFMIYYIVMIIFLRWCKPLART